MSVLAVLLVGVGLADLVRAALAAPDSPPGSDGQGRRGWLVATVVGVVTVLALAAAAGLLAVVGGIALTLLAVVSLVSWMLLSRAALVGDVGPRVPGSVGYVLPLAALGLGLVLQLALAGWAPPVGGWIDGWARWADLPWEVAPEQAMLVLGLALVQLATGNVVVRLVLVATGAMEAAPSVDGADQELRGGRLLGPLERLFILGLGLAGEVTAAGLVIAAKGLIRWPELRAHPSPGAGSSDRPDDTAAGPSGIDKVTEYFLVGSFVSWLVALTALALAS